MHSGAKSCGPFLAGHAFGQSCLVSTVNSDTARVDGGRYHAVFILYGYRIESGIRAEGGRSRYYRPVIVGGIIHLLVVIVGCRPVGLDGVIDLNVVVLGHPLVVGLCHLHGVTRARIGETPCSGGVGYPAKLGVAYILNLHRLVKFLVPCVGRIVYVLIGGEYIRAVGGVKCGIRRPGLPVGTGIAFIVYFREKISAAYRECSGVEFRDLGLAFSVIKEIVPVNCVGVVIIIGYYTPFIGHLLDPVLLVGVLFIFGCHTHTRAEINVDRIKISACCIGEFLFYRFPVLDLVYPLIAGEVIGGIQVSRGAEKVACCRVPASVGGLFAKLAVVVRRSVHYPAGGTGVLVVYRRKQLETGLVVILDIIHYLLALVSDEISDIRQFRAASPVRFCLPESRPGTCT